mmetsp:Transcript_4564/g.5644  ORF Transcript_4564/g.5644 Transcript_4564/m.5644 type:complete len:205 (-) Transcript_4564:1050-1664(-)
MCSLTCSTRCWRRTTKRCMSYTSNTRSWRTNSCVTSTLSAAHRASWPRSSLSCRAKTPTTESLSLRTMSLVASASSASRRISIQVSVWCLRRTSSVKLLRCLLGTSTKAVKIFRRPSRSCAAGARNGVRRRSLSSTSSAAGAKCRLMKVKRRRLCRPHASPTNRRRHSRSRELLRSNSLGRRARQVTVVKSNSPSQSLRLVVTR